LRLPANYDSVFSVRINLDLVQEFDAGGNFITQWPVGGPNDITIDANDYKYVTTSNDVKVFDADNNYMYSFGNAANGNQLSYPGGIAIDE